MLFSTKWHLKTSSVSLDGLKETHEALRGVRGSFDKVLANLKLLRAAGFWEHLQVTTVVFKRNIGQLEALHALLKPLGLDSWRVALVDPISRSCCWGKRTFSGIRILSAPIREILSF